MNRHGLARLDDRMEDIQHQWLALRSFRHALYRNPTLHYCPSLGAIAHDGEAEKRKRGGYY